MFKLRDVLTKEWETFKTITQPDASEFSILKILSLQYLYHKLLYTESLPEPV